MARTWLAGGLLRLRADALCIANINSDLWTGIVVLNVDNRAARVQFIYRDNDGNDRGVREFLLDPGEQLG